MNERIVTKTVTRRTTPTRIPIQENTVSSNTVSSLKCDATPRHFCIEIRKTSPRDAIPRAAATTHPVTLPNLRNVMNQVSVATATPKEKPNRIGLRHDSGPCNEPPSIKKTTECTAALSKRSAAHA